MSNIVSHSPAIVRVEGKTVTERKLSALTQGTYGSALSLCNEKGKIGAAARMATAKGGLAALAKEVAQGNYKGLAARLAALTGEDWVISNRATLESLPDQFEQRIAAAKRGKNGGYTISKKTGLSSPSSKLSTAMLLKGECIEILASASALVDAVKAKREAVTQD